MRGRPVQGVVKRMGKLLVAVISIVVIFSAGFVAGSGSLPFGRKLSPFGANKDLPKDLDYSSVEEVYDALKENYDGELASDALFDGLKQGLARASGDPYTEYFNVADSKEFENSLNGTFEGIGAELSKEENAIIVVAPIAGFPAEKAGLRPQDIIAEIDGKSAFDLSVSEAVKRIRGPKGTTVKLKIVRDRKQEIDFEITRDQINIPSVTTETLSGNIGYIKISRFGDDTSQLTRAAANSFKQAGVKGVILDLRGNPGGLLEASVDVSSLWLRNKLVLQEKRGDKVVKTYNSRGSSPLEGLPTVVLVNEGSASASEIVAGALKDNKAATVIGKKSFGKGSVQELHSLGAGGRLKVTIARWYTPAGKNIDQEGIEPDTKVDFTEDDFKNKLDPQKDAAIHHLNR